MENIPTVEKLPACPVETTLTLISDKWKVLILRDLLPGVKEINRTCLTESVDSTASTDGAERTCESKSICRGAAKS